MTADTNFSAGGDSIIFATFSQNSRASGTIGEVNQLIIECSTSKESLCRLYEMFKDNVFAIAFSITADYHLSEDCVTETFVRLSQVKKFSHTKGDGKGFILTIARNVALELRRRYKREITDDIIQSYGETEQTVEDSIYINQLLRYLNDKQRQIVVLKCCAELTFKEIAKIMKAPETTIKSRYKRAIAILQEKAGVTSEKE
ncbi:MAG: sigma-70 family RNA polymerase sigma factor [Ruminococcus sp.]|nr:sigma-70 family RNA polymerase sigma factor [Ruminococcus sp.]HRR78144.1 sigma-70 family RNA polymerase sigma factor [Ruminococcus sp.]